MGDEQVESMARVSVCICIPAYENVDFLGRLLESIFAQDYKDFLIVVTDDSSTDAIREYVSKIAPLMRTEIHYKRNQYRLGATGNCNEAIKTARTYSPKYIKIMHHDDFFTYPYSLGKMVEALEQNPRCALFFSGTWHLSADGSYARGISEKQEQCLRRHWEYLYKANAIGAPSAVLLRSDAFEAMDERLVWLVDVDLYMSALSKNKEFLCTKEPLVSIGMNAGRLTDECTKDRDLIRSEYQYLYEKYPSLHTPFGFKTMMRESKKGLNPLSQCCWLARYVDFVFRFFVKGIRRNYWWYGFRIRRAFSNAIASLRHKERKKEPNLQYDIVGYLSKASALDMEQKQILHWLNHHKLSYVFPYDFVKKYKKMKIDILHDGDRPYVLFKEKRMYFKLSMRDKDIVSYMRSLYCEQDEQSPHYYDIKRTQIENKIVADMGAAEGIFSLSIIDDVKKVYLFECDDEWNEALHRTFEPYKGKVEFVGKYIDSVDSENSITMDTFFANREIQVVKADIEGYEIPMLQGGEKTFTDSIEYAILCSYHNQEDEEKIRTALQKYGFSTHCSQGYMIFMYGKPLTPPFLRRGLIYGEKLRKFRTSSSKMFERSYL